MLIHRRVPISTSCGRRPVFILSQIVCLVASIWRARATSYGSFMGACILNGIGAGPAETIQPAVIADIFFLHDRGFWNTLYWVAYMGSLMVGPVSACESTNDAAASFLMCCRLSAGPWPCTSDGEVSGGSMLGSSASRSPWSSVSALHAWSLLSLMQAQSCSLKPNGIVFTQTRLVLRQTSRQWIPRTQPVPTRLRYVFLLRRPARRQNASLSSTHILTCTQAANDFEKQNGSRR